MNFTRNSRRLLLENIQTKTKFLAKLFCSFFGIRGPGLAGYCSLDNLKALNRSEHNTEFVELALKTNPTDLFTVLIRHFRNSKGTRAEMCPVIVSGLLGTHWSAIGQLFPPTTNSARCLCKT